MKFEKKSKKLNEGKLAVLLKQKSKNSVIFWKHFHLANPGLPLEK